ncbi:hypothetical protein [Nocardia sp. R7R-8]|uniref:hypothetical protein n=1 Tax=Nocardia sp. R7R-8 TaxID=3459304 RepID=UPI00403E208E
MVCCMLLAGLALFGPRGAALYRFLRGQRSGTAIGGRSAPEVQISTHLVLTPAGQERP